MSDDRRPLIAQVCASFPPRVCGIADYTSCLTDALRECGARVEVWTGAGETTPQAGRVHPVVAGWGAAGVRALAADLVAARPALVHLQYERAIYEQQAAVCFLLPRLLKRAGIPLVTTFHALDGPRGWGKAHRAALLPLLWGSRDLVVCSRRQETALRHLPFIEKKVSLIPVGSVVPVTTPPRREPAGKPLRLVYFGFVWRGRNLETLLRSLRAVVAAGTEATLAIVGGVCDPAYRAELETLAVALGVSERVQWCGELPASAISEHLAHANVVLLPFETGVSTGRTTLMAAMAHHAPVVTMAAHDNLSPLFVNGENMVWSPAGDEAAFIAAVQSVVGNSALRARLSHGAARLSENFAWPVLARQTLALPTYRGAGQ